MPDPIRRDPGPKAQQAPWARPIPIVAFAVLVLGVAVAVGLPRFVPGIPAGQAGSGVPTSSAPLHSPGAASPSGLPPTVQERYPDGIPSAFALEAVLRPPDLNDSLPRAGASSFLLGGWSPGLYAPSCPALNAGDPAYLLTPPCGGWPIGDTPLASDTHPPFKVGVITDGHVIPGGPVVLRVHAGDRRAAQCPADRRAACEAALVVDNVVWVGQDDPLTATAPLRGDQVADRLLTVFPDLRLLPREQRCGDGASCSTGASIGGASCDPGWPLQMWETNEDQVPRILVFPSAAALRETQANLTANGWLGMGRDRSPCTVSHDPAFASDWIDVENVLIEVDVAASGATPAQQKLIDEIRTSLSARP